MRIFIDFWKLETEKSILHLFLHKLSFENNFCFLFIFGLRNKCLSLKNRKLFLKTENKGKKQLPNIILLCFTRITYLMISSYKASISSLTLHLFLLDEVQIEPKTHWHKLVADTSCSWMIFVLDYICTRFYAFSHTFHWKFSENEFLNNV